jgi:hypothetical protein
MIQTLSELVSNYNPTLQDAAIEELLSLLEIHTGHFDMIVRSLERDQEYLSIEQLQRFKQLTQSDNESNKSGKNQSAQQIYTAPLQIQESE